MSIKSLSNYLQVRNLGAVIIDHIREEFLISAFNETGNKHYLLDLGCGVKPFKPLYDKYTDKNIGIDVATTPHSQHMVDKLYDGLHIPFNSNEFDIVFTTEVMEHVMEPETFLREINRVLKPGGTLIFTVPFFASLHEEPYDFYRYTRHGLNYLLDKTGFDVIRLEAFSGYTGVLISILVKPQLKLWSKLSRLFKIKPIYSLLNPFIFLFAYLPQLLYLYGYKLTKNSSSQKMPKGYGLIAVKK